MRPRDPDYCVAERLAHEAVLGHHGQKVDFEVSQPNITGAIVEIPADTWRCHF